MLPHRTKGTYSAPQTTKEQREDPWLSCYNRRDHVMTLKQLRKAQSKSRYFVSAIARKVGHHKVDWALSFGGDGNPSVFRRVMKNINYPFGRQNKGKK